MELRHYSKRTGFDRSRWAWYGGICKRTSVRLDDTIDSMLITLHRIVHIWVREKYTWLLATSHALRPPTGRSDYPRWSYDYMDTNGHTQVTCTGRYCMVYTVLVAYHWVMWSQLSLVTLWLQFCLKWVATWEWFHKWHINYRQVYHKLLGLVRAIYQNTHSPKHTFARFNFSWVGS